MAISKTWVMFTLIKGHIRQKKSQVQSWQTAISETKVIFSHDKRPYHKQEWSQVMTNSHIRNKHHFQSWQTAMSEIRVRFSLDKQQWKKKKKKHTHTHTKKKKKKKKKKEVLFRLDTRPWRQSFSFLANGSIRKKTQIQSWQPAVREARVMFILNKHIRHQSNVQTWQMPLQRSELCLVLTSSIAKSSVVPKRPSRFRDRF